MVPNFGPPTLLQGSDEVDISMLGMMALYSEVHPTVSYIIHYGMDVLAPVYKLQVSYYFNADLFPCLLY